MLQSFIFSSRLQTRKERSAHRIGNPRTLLEVPRNLSVTAHPPRTGSPSKDLRWVMKRCVMDEWNLIAKYFLSQATSMGSITTCWDCSSTEAFHPSQTTCSWAIMWIVESSHWRRSACCWRTKSNIQRTSSCSAATTSAPALIEFTGEFPSPLADFTQFLILWFIQILRRMQATIQHQIMENVHRLL